jgi:tetratricopeptide (TPR) repeat protein
MTPESMRTRGAKIRWCLGALVVWLIAAAVFLPSISHQFVAFDDPAYVQRNPEVLRGLTPASVRWAFTAFHASNWHPLTWISHMLDVELFGVEPAGHHLVNVLFHAGAAAALFLLLEALTGSFWPALGASLAFAVHPLRVESVAWVAERKDVLAAFLGILAMAAYVRQMRRPAAQGSVGLLVLYAVGLMAKPMLVTLPLLLLMLDFWPLGRLRRAADLRQVLSEKAPLFAMAIVASFLTLLAQEPSVVTLGQLPPGARLANAAVAAVTYLGQMIWPFHLAVYYPLQRGGPGPAAAGAALSLLLLASAAALRGRRLRPYLAVGWVWFVVSLLPVLGIVQVGEQAHADRYTYLPSVGIFMAVVWLTRDCTRGRARARTAAVAVGTILLASWCLLTIRQLRWWENTVTLSEHTLEVTGPNPLVRYVYGEELARQGRDAEAREQFRRTVDLAPQFAEAHYGFGVTRERTGDAIGAMLSYRAALRLQPRHAEASNNLGVLYARAGDLRAAIRHYRSAIEAQPDFAEARRNLQSALAASGEAP